MTDQDNKLMMEKLQSMEVTSVTVRYAARRSIRVPTLKGDEFRTAESEVAWEIQHRDGPVSKDEAYAATLYFTPILMKKVLFDLVVAGVMSKEEVAAKMAYITKQYAQVLDGTKDKDADRTEQGMDSKDVRTTGDVGGASGTGPSEGTTVFEGKDNRMPHETGPSYGHAGPSPETPSGSENSSSEHERGDTDLPR